jgi:hypothetical protein
LTIINLSFISDLQYLLRKVVSLAVDKLTHFCGPRTGPDPVHAARILGHNPTRGTQDVNDPDRPGGRIAGPQAGSFTSWVPLLR